MVWLGIFSYFLTENVEQAAWGLLFLICRQLTKTMEDIQIPRKKQTFCTKTG